MPFIAGRSSLHKGTGGFGVRPFSPSVGTLAASINSPGQVSTPSMTEDENNASFSWSSPGATGVGISIPFTAPNNGGLPITDYEYSTDNGTTWKSAGTISTPISISTVSGSTSALASSTTYQVRIRAVNALGKSDASTAKSITTPDQVTSYDIEVWDTRPATDVLVTTITQTSNTYSRTHKEVENDFAVKVRAKNDNGNGTYSDISSSATGWVYSAYDADYARTRGCTRSGDCDSCGSKSGTEDGTARRTCRKWSWKGTDKSTGLNCTWDKGTDEETATDWDGNCRDQGACSGYWSTQCGDAYDGYTYRGSDWLGYGCYYVQNGCYNLGTCGCGCQQFHGWIISKCTVTGAVRYEDAGCVTWVISCGK